MELRIFLTKSKFLRWFQWKKVQSWNRLRLGRLVIEFRKLTPKPITVYMAFLDAQAQGLISIEGGTK